MKNLKEKFAKFKLGEILKTLILLILGGLIFGKILVFAQTSQPAGTIRYNSTTQTFEITPGGGNVPPDNLSVGGNLSVNGKIKEGGNILIPTGTVIFYDGPSCPAGWTELTEARGRVILGLPSGGTLKGTKGTALNNLGARTITEVPSHTHLIDPPPTITTTDGSHTHSYNDLYWSEHWGDVDIGNDGWDNNVGGNSGQDYDNDGYQWVRTTGSAGSHSHTVDIPPFTSSPTGVSAVDVTMPYIQLLVCKKQ